MKAASWREWLRLEEAATSSEVQMAPLCAPTRPNGDKLIGSGLAVQMDNSLRHAARESIEAKRKTSFRRRRGHLIAVQKRIAVFFSQLVKTTMEAGEATHELEEAAPEAWQSIVGSGARTDSQISILPTSNLSVTGSILTSEDIS